MNKISRSEKLKDMTKIERDMEGMVTMSDLMVLYNKKIQSRLDELTDDPVLQDQVLWLLPSLSAMPFLSLSVTYLLEIP